MEKIRHTQLRGSNRCFSRRTKPFQLSCGKSQKYQEAILQKSLIKNFFRSKALGMSEDILDAISLIKTGTVREDVPDELLYAYDSVKSILRTDPRFDLRTLDFDDTKAYVTVLLAKRPKYIKDVILRNYNEVYSFDTKESGRISGLMVAERVLRYLSDEKRDLVVPDEITLDLFGQEVDVKPDLLSIDYHKKTVEAIEIRKGKSTVSSRGTKRDHNLLNNLELYSLYAYAREIGREKWGPDCLSKGSFYFLRKEADKSTRQYQEPGFFGCKNMKHVATLSDYAGSTAARADKLDEIYEPQFKEYIIGEECEGDDCTNCERYELCHFTEAPLSSEEERKAKSPHAIKLSPAQERVKDFRKGIMRCNAGAGSGKTTVVALNTAFMIAEGVDPKSILLITFSNAGAGEMKERTLSYLSGLGMDVNEDDLKIVTFNQFGQEIIEKEFRDLGYTAPPRPIDDTERSMIIARELNEHAPVPGLYYEDINLSIKNFKGARHVAEAAFHAIKRDRLSEYDVDRLKDALSDMDASIQSEEAFPALLRLYDHYEETMRERNLIEFQDQESHMFDMLDIDPYYFDEMGYKHIIIDEFQDTSRNQLEIIKNLVNVSDFESLLVVGDDSQAIYSWRDADISNIIEFEDRIGRTVEDVNLVENYRSTPEIISFANEVNARCARRIEKDLIATRPSGKPVIVKGFHKVDKEYDFIVETVKEKLSEGYAPEDIAILAYKKNEVVKIAGKLAEAGIPACLQAPQKMLENSRIQGILSLARAYKDFTATKEVLIFQNCLSGGKALDLDVDEIRDLIDEGQKMILNMRGLIEPQRATAFLNLCDEIAGEDDLAVKFADRLDRFRTVDDIIEYIEAFERFGGEELRREGKYSGVILSTAHSSKGLEWPVVINSITKYDSENMGLDEREEKQRLLFVSSTRARDELIITGQIKLCGNVETGYTINRFVNEAADIVGVELDLVDEDEKAERARKREKRKADEADRLGKKSVTKKTSKMNKEKAAV